MFKVGLTGGIGSGKTTVSKIFKSLGIEIFYADLEAARIIASDRSVIETLVSWYGSPIYQPDGLLNKDRFATIIFNNEAERLKVNALVHPLVIEKFKSWADQQTCRYVINEAALHFETGNDRNMNTMITVTAPAGLRLERVSKRDGRSVDLVKKIMAQQLSEEYKTARSKYIINNSGNQLIIPQVLEIHNSILATL